MSAANRRLPAWYPVVILCGLAVLISYMDRTNISIAALPMQAQFKWDETTKGYVLSSFFVGYLLLMAASGALANKYGGRLILGIAVLWWSLFTALTPPAAMMGFGALISARIALGLGEAAVFPASINMVGRWVPKEHRTRAVALFTSMLSIGTIISGPSTGRLIRDYGWPVAFYAFGALGIVWAAFWFGMVKPGRSPDVPEETSTSRTIPWGRLLSSKPIWAIVINHFCSNWALYVLLAWLPTYFIRTFQVSLTAAGFLYAVPWVVYFIMGNVGGWFADKLMVAGKSPTFVRKLMQCTAVAGAGTFLLLLQLAPNATVAMVFMCLSAGTMSLCLSGFAANPFDVAPKYADVVWGISNTGGTLPGIIGVAVTGWLIDKTGNFNAPFLLTAGVGYVGALVMLAWGSGEKQVE